MNRDFLKNRKSRETIREMQEKEILLVWVRFGIEH